MVNENGRPIFEEKKAAKQRPANDDKEGGRVDETTAVCAYLRVVASTGTAVQPPRRWNMNDRVLSAQMVEFEVATSCSNNASDR